MELIHEFKKARIWKTEDNNYDETLYVEADNAPFVVYFTASDEDGYRSRLIFGDSLKRLSFVMMEGRALLGEFEDVKIFEDDTSSEYLEYLIYSKGEQIASAYEDDRDDYYPCATLTFFDKNEFKKKWNAAEKEISYTFRKFPNIPKNKEKSIIVTGEPRIGKTTMLLNYAKSRGIDSDSFSATEAFDYLYRPIFSSHFIIGKYRNTIVKTAEGDFSFKDAATKILQDREIEVFELEFLNRVGPEYDGYGVLIDNHTTEKLHDYFIDVSKVFKIGHVSLKCGKLPENNYILAKLTAKTQ